jgi:predicted DNA-binding WGR domain protein
MNAVILYRIDQAKNMHRFYRLDVQPDLFGQWCLMREWGRIGSTGQTRSAPFPTPQEAQAALEKQSRVKERRGYFFHFRTELAHGIPRVESRAGL